MLRTVKEVSELSGVTVKALHHYHKIGLLAPCGITDAGYRLYGRRELEKLQQILFYRELDLPLATIKRLLDERPERQSILSGQRKLLDDRRRRLERLIRTLDESLDSERRGEPMDQEKLFEGFATEAEWREALKDQDEHLEKTYGFDPRQDREPIDVADMNEQAAEAARFMADMAAALRAGTKASSEEVGARIERHLEFQRRHGHETNAAVYAGQCRFFLDDDFHRGMLESQQTGLAYYLCAAAEAYAAKA
ncbi:MerR family transcriptional regulator [Cohnella zeiphila]|uniref:MerR family transcriptional regulator n=1 Tax=Cohnella zeiphila TaxID=2761120 RepID=A0A7X0SHA0_9BACL|nr:MerR family transcriptional regulator [Cohnella zeiphila]MBB6729946.1 MerR family transcriptional regulator [Cohnella zeiphila]